MYLSFATFLSEQLRVMIKYMKNHHGRLYATMVLTIKHMGHKCQEMANLSIMMMM